LLANRVLVGFGAYLQAFSDNPGPPPARPFLHLRQPHAAAREIHAAALLRLSGNGKGTSVLSNFPVKNIFKKNSHGQRMSM
jgi:hypothetical protein